MVKAEPAPCAWPIGRTPYTFRRCAEFPVFFATGNGTRRLPPFHASMEAAVPLSCFGWIASQNNPMRDKTRRSEEHTSELQSLMRISYAVFCLKKKTQHKQ